MPGRLFPRKERELQSLCQRFFNLENGFRTSVSVFSTWKMVSESLSAFFQFGKWFQRLCRRFFSLKNGFRASVGNFLGLAKL